MIRRRRLTDEEKAAVRIANSVVDLRLDIEEIGRYLGEISSFVEYNRLQEIAEAAKFYREERNHGRFNRYTVF